MIISALSTLACVFIGVLLVWEGSARWKNVENT